MTEAVRFLCCPDCLQPLEPAGSTLTCRNCGHPYGTAGGVWDFASDSPYYYGEIPQPEMRAILRNLAESPMTWANAYAVATAHLPRQQQVYAEEYATAMNRTGWKVLCPLHGGAALDIGCGWGLITMSLAPHFDHVVALDLCLERAQMTVARCREQGLKNVVGVHAGGTGSLPFPADSFDLIIVNGVLEYVATSRPGNPRQLQLEYLRELRRVLKPAGQLYLAIENRYYWRYLLGARDHSGIRGIAPLPRTLAHGLARLHGQPSYREYLYSQRGYRKLLGEAGFEVTKFSLPYPIYWEPRTIIPAEGGLAGWRQAYQPRSTKGKLLHRLGAIGNLYQKFASSFAINCATGTLQPNFLDRVAGRLNERRISGGADWQWTYFKILTGGKIKVFFHSPATHHQIVVTVATTALSRGYVERQTQFLRKLRSNPRLPDSLKALFPETLAEWEDCHLLVLVEPHAQGVPASTLQLDETERGQIRSQIVELLAGLHQATASPAGRVTFFRELLEFAHRHSRFASAAVEQEMTNAVNQFDALQLPGVFVHGDLGLHNVFVDPKSTQITAILDWDASIEAGPAGLDLVNMHLWEILQQGERRICDGLRELSNRYPSTHPYAGEFSRYAKAAGNPADLWALLVKLYPLWSFHHLLTAHLVGGHGKVMQWNAIEKQFRGMFVKI